MSAAITAAAVGAGISAYGANQAKKGAGKAPKPVNIFQIQNKGPYRGTSVAQSQAGGLLGYYQQNVPEFIKLQDQLGPQLMGQMFGQTGQFLSGASRLSRQAGQAAQGEISSLRSQDISSMTGQAAGVRSLMQKLSPEQARAIELQRLAAERAPGLENEFQAAAQPYSGIFGTMAQEAFARRGTLSPEEERMAQQRARESSSQAGRLGGSSAIASEILNREAAQSARRQEAVSIGGLAQEQMMQTEARRAAIRNEAQTANQMLSGLAQGFYSGPGMQLLSGTPAAYAAGQNSLRTAMIGGPESSGSFDYNMPLNLAMGQAGAQNSSNMANYQIASANAQAQAKMYSDIGSSLMGAGFNMAAAGGGGWGTGAGAGGGIGASTNSAYTHSAPSPGGRVNYSYV